MKCSHDPKETKGPIGMYHCPECGEMVVAGIDHPNWEKEEEDEEQMTDKFDDGGPAYPSHGTMGEVCHEGSTLWDFYAAAARYEEFCPGGASHKRAAEERARICADFADAMIAERKKRMGG